MNDYNVSGCYSLDSLNSFGLTFDYFDIGLFIATNSVGQVSTDAHLYESFLDFRYARTVTRDFSAGIGLKYFTSYLGTYSIATSSGAIATTEYRFHDHAIAHRGRGRNQ